jgi:hypothetical protein
MMLGRSRGRASPAVTLNLTLIPTSVALSRQGYPETASAGAARAIPRGLPASSMASLPNMLSSFNDGGLGILIGDGQLPHPGPEQIIEAYYQFAVFAWKVTFDYQFVVNPAYNRACFNARAFPPVRPTLRRRLRSRPSLPDDVVRVRRTDMELVSRCRR